ncbi:unnamed protein product [Peronospora belbahrii]|uniref:Late endosomal/lysosomal adaptor and MAPK and MTOR activator 5 n=1 Tax=Peronospora belbahrii TaxID=622444 RepID=A0AAU9KRJ8_9STRA|nr:unnamed protein product [Peronospora belbahrii]CAH0514160.1 unnamed protein product [Peronospora belbahrii]
MSQETLGLVLNDGHGLLLRAEGDLEYTSRDQKSGFFTCIAEKAIDLGQFVEEEEEEAVKNDGKEEQFLPTIRLDTNRRSLLITKFETSKCERTLVVSKPREIIE